MRKHRALKPRHWFGPLTSRELRDIVEEFSRSVRISRI